MELSVLKRDRHLFFAVVQVKGEGKHLPCPFHGGGDSFSTWCGEDGVWLWKCHSQGCGSGTIIDAAMKRYSVHDCHAALLAIEKDLGIPIAKDEEYIEPRIDQQRAQAFVEYAHNTLINSPEIQERWLTKKRGISIETAIKYKLGFVDGDKFKGVNWDVFGWSIPITDAAGRLVFVKMHLERPPWPEGPKCLSAPFGTYPEYRPRRMGQAEIKPKHGTNILWPAPESFGQVEKLYLCPGELKALALCSAGLPATSPTTGENKLPDRLIERLKRCKPGAVFIVFDDDPVRNGKSKGRDWRDSMLAALKEKGVGAYAFAYGKTAVQTPARQLVVNDKQLVDNRNSDRHPAAVPANVDAKAGATAPEKEWAALENKIERERLIAELQEVAGPTAVSESAKIADIQALIRLAQPLKDQTLDRSHFLV